LIQLFIKVGLALDSLQITNNDFDDLFPRIDDGEIVWIKQNMSDLEIYLWSNGATKQIINDNSYSTPEIDNGQIVWNDWDGNDNEIY
jgi:hypothetical protein